MHEIAPEELGEGHGHQPTPLAASRLPVHPVAQRHRARLARHQPLVREGTAPQIPGQIGRDPVAVGVALPDMHMPLRAAQFVQQMLPLLAALARGSVSLPCANPGRIAASRFP